MRLWLLLILLIPLQVIATGIEIENQATAEGSTVTTGSSTAFGFAHSLGDVDINQCLASTQWGTILVSAQKVVLNLWCAGEVFDAKGLPAMAAIMRCDIPEIKRHFNTQAECIAANTVTVPMSEVVISPEHYEEEEEWHEEQLQMQQDYDERIERLEARANRPRQTVEQKPLLTEDQKARLEEVLEK